MVSYMDFLITSFWGKVLSNHFSQPNFTDLLRLSESIVRVHYSKKRDANRENYEEHLRKEHTRLIEKLVMFEENTTEDVKMPLSVVEFMIFKNWQKSPDIELNIKGKRFKIYILFRELNKVIREMSEIVNDIGMYYSLDTEFGSGIFGGGGDKKPGLSLGKKIRDDDQ